VDALEQSLSERVWDFLEASLLERVVGDCEEKEVDQRDFLQIC
jgi:hypothetical protein